jgi:hypothetical protein
LSPKYGCVQPAPRQAAIRLNGDHKTRAALFAEDAIFEDPVGTTRLRGTARQC